MTPLFLLRGLFKTDRVVGTAQLKLEPLETACELREILEVSLKIAFALPARLSVPPVQGE